MSPQAIAAVTTLINCIVDTILICSSERQTSSLDETPIRTTRGRLCSSLILHGHHDVRRSARVASYRGLNFRYRCNQFIFSREAHHAFAFTSVPGEDWIVVKTVFGTAPGFKLIQFG